MPCTYIMRKKKGTLRYTYMYTTTYLGELSPEILVLKKMKQFSIFITQKKNKIFHKPASTK